MEIIGRKGRRGTKQINILEGIIELQPLLKAKNSCDNVYFCVWVVQPNMNNMQTDYEWKQILFFLFLPWKLQK